ncbi:22501_t:CDS:2 [Dentiscutata erythropus]|uniref:22501_t:CDS:1 n=1 Tax=Dentiscutata erythropus TaxID=1348616 RepID=A0A9N9AQT0_9GLOM|nr:22501_t:CDS:2 [Dentiscutata erythropus]
MFQLRTQLGGPSNNLENLNLSFKISSISSLIILPEKFIVDILQPLSLNYIQKEISLPSSNLSNLPPLISEAPTSNSKISSTTNKNLDINVNNLTTLYNTQPKFLCTTCFSQSNRIVSHLLKSWVKYKVSEYQFNENNSDAYEIIDEVKRQNKIIKKKLKSLSAKCLYDLAKNAYFQEQEVKPDLRGYISIKLQKEKYSPIGDIFDYYFRKEVSRRNTFNIGFLDEKRSNQLRNFLDQKEIIKTEIDKILKEGLIQSCQSSLTSPVVLVPKPNDLLDALNGSSWYSSLDLTSGYWQVEVENSDKLKTAFTTPFGVYIFHVISLG